MGWFDNIRRFLYHKKLRFDAKAHADAERTMLNLKHARNVGILFNATDAKDIITVTKFAENLSGKDVSILAFQNTKEKNLQDPRFINKLDLNWFYIPSGEKIERFHAKPFDILICAFIDECLPLEYIAATSSAKFRVGAFNESSSHHYELMINTNTNKNLKYLLDQINHFLNVINP